MDNKNYEDLMKMYNLNSTQNDNQQSDVKGTLNENRQRCIDMLMQKYPEAMKYVRAENMSDLEVQNIFRGLELVGKTSDIDNMEDLKKYFSAIQH